MNLTNETLVSGLMDFLFIFIFSLIGAIVKDTYNTLIGKEKNVKIGRIVISAMVSSILVFSLLDWLLSKIGWRSIVLPCFVGGLIGFDSLSKISNIQFWAKLYNLNKAFNGDFTEIKMPEEDSPKEHPPDESNIEEDKKDTPHSFRLIDTNNEDKG